jgi:tRNA(fMet)-specific endonuclease VapC
MKYLLDTNILVNAVRNTPLFQSVEMQLDLFSPNHSTHISTVSVGEIYSLALRNQWGQKRQDALEAFLQLTQTLPVATRQLMKAYAEIDAYSQGKHPTLHLPTGVSSRNMGKNDLWIAATAHILDATLVSTDKDFYHLDGVFLQLYAVSV